MITTIPIVRKLLAKNEHAASENRARFDGLGVTCVNVLGGAGCGKTALLEAVLPRLTAERRVAVLEGDLATTRDAERIAALGVPTAQLLTDGGCHLTATHVQRALERVPLDALDLLIIENVGNPICPANFDLGEHARLAVLSVAEGEDKPVKYPLLFKGAQAVAISKCDLLPHLRYDLRRTLADIRRINPDAATFAVAAHTGAGVEPLVEWLRRLSAATLDPAAALA
ncbi:MAG TPA: hydrogenase nickel incorporation protein HypB [Phycisphaerae bacterium]|nr:hydrogenase nickel incorporation protein HypB [Phycisphaerae bacterium]